MAVTFVQNVCEPCYLYRQQHFHADTCSANGVKLLRCPPPATSALSQIRWLVPTATFQMLTVALVNQWLDYRNSTLVGIPAYLMCRLQSALNAAARLIFHLRRSDHVTDSLVSLHWLRVPERIQFKIAVLTYRVFHGDAPPYLGPFTSTTDVG